MKLVLIGIALSIFFSIMIEAFFKMKNKPEIENILNFIVWGLDASQACAWLRADGIPQDDAKTLHKLLQSFVTHHDATFGHNKHGLFMLLEEHLIFAVGINADHVSLTVGTKGGALQMDIRTEQDVEDFFL